MDRRRLSRAFNSSNLILVILVIFLFISTYPVIWLLISSFKSPNEFTRPAFSLPQALYLENYIRAWVKGNLGTYYQNSIVSTTGALLLIILTSSTISFAITKMKWKLKSSAMTLFSLGILIPTQVVLIPLFMIFRSLSLINNLTSLILSLGAFGMSMSIFLFNSYFSSIPNEIFESAIIDGCSIYGVFTRIVLPLIRNAIVTVLVVQFFNVWNDLIFSMTFISRNSLKTIQTGLLFFADEFGNVEWGLIFAAIVITVLPTILVYFLLNKLVMRGMTSGAVKG
ncbi:MAG TPA: carbohydrate ABC transporter permease [Clostridiales bacterium]|nr:carbohydrate ABC transporter permease [Clostridiales bacterium]